MRDADDTDVGLGPKRAMSGTVPLPFASLVEVNGVVWLDDRDMEGGEKMGSKN